jgi:hypothetical protein
MGNLKKVLPVATNRSPSKKNQQNPMIPLFYKFNLLIYATLYLKPAYQRLNGKQITGQWSGTREKPKVSVFLNIPVGLRCC